MAAPAPTKARLRTAYDLGAEHARNDEPGGPPDYIAHDDELMEAWDQGFSDAVDEMDGGRGGDEPRTHTPPSSSPSTKPRKAAGGSRRPPAKSKRRNGKFSHPLHWGTGAQGHVVGKPTLSPRGLSMSDGTGFMFGLLLYTLGLSYLKHGPRGVTGWLSAKFLNRPYPDFMQAAAGRRAAHGPKVGVASDGTVAGAASRTTSRGPVKYV